VIRIGASSSPSVALSLGVRSPVAPSPFGVGSGLVSGSGFGLGRAVVNYAVVNNAAVDHAAGDYAAVNHAAIEHFVLRSSNDDPSRGVDPSELADERRDDGRVEHRY